MQQSLALASLTIAAIIIGPVAALWLQRISERRRDKRNRKLVIFKELMATRASRVSPRHVDALNAIEVEFSNGSRRDKQVLEAWRLYLDHLSAPDNGNIQQWGHKREDLFFHLLYTMSQALEFAFSELDLKNNIYSPIAQGDLENDQYLLRKYIVEVMDGKRAILAEIVTGGEPLDIRLVGETQGTPGAHPAESRSELGEAT